MSTAPTIFNRIINGEIPGYIPYETATIAVLIALEGHPLVIPKHPYRDITELPEDVAAELMRVATRVAKAMKTATHCDGVNLIQSNGTAAGQEVFHFHLHVIPRFTNDHVSIAWDTTPKEAAVRSTLADQLRTTLND